MLLDGQCVINSNVDFEICKNFICGFFDLNRFVFAFGIRVGGSHVVA